MLNLKKKSELWLKEVYVDILFLIQVVFLPDNEELDCPKVYIKFLEVITIVFTYSFILLHLKMAVHF